MKLLFAAVLLLINAPCRAATYLFSVTTDPGVAQQFPTFSFALPDTPIPDADLGYGFTIAGVPTNGTSQFGPISYNADYSFYTGTGLYAGFDDGTAYHSYFSRQLFTGSTAAPTFNLGTYALYDNDAGPKIAILVISRANSPGAVPEPASWMMMLTGLGAVGIAMRRKPRDVGRSFAPDNKRR